MGHHRKCPGHAGLHKLLGGQTKERIPAYCTGNDIEQHAEFGYKKIKLAIPYGPADGREGMKKNTELVKRTRQLLGPDGEIMLDCWMAFDERYTVEFAEMLEPYRVYWMEECLPPDDYAGFGRLNAQIKSTRHCHRVSTNTRAMDFGCCWNTRRPASGSLT